MTGEGTPLWSPSPERVARAWITQYAAHLEATHGLAFGGDYHALWRWSVQDIATFWASIWTYFDVAGTPGRTVLGRRSMPGTEWFPGAHLSYTHHVFRGRRDEDVAIVHRSETRPGGEVTWGELARQTAEIGNGLRALGVQRGDRVAAWLPNTPETVAAFLAVAGLGAIWSSAAPEFGARGVIERFQQIEPKVLLTVDGYRYNGRDHDRRAPADEIAAAVGARQVRFGYLDGSGWEEGFLAPAGDGPPQEIVPFDHPLWVVYSSGTTGLPKPIVHSHGGILLEQLKKGHLHFDMHADDRMFWFTTAGWAMWNILIGVLLTPAAIVLYDGSPNHPDLDVLWDLAAETGITTFGTSAGYLSQCLKAGITPAEGRDLSALTAVGSTGSPLAPEGFDWVYDQLGADTWLYSTSGGTDVCTAFVGGVPTLPVHRGELQARALGCDVQAWNEQGESVVGEVGELVLPQPMPSMPLYLWNDPGGARYHESYFDRFPGVWCHGDWITITERGSAVITGRSDATINRGGVRMGTSEIYGAVLAEPEVADALVVDVTRDDGSVHMPLFVVLRPGASLDAALIARLRTRIREECSPRHLPDSIIQIDEVPRTLSGKPLEIPVKRILMGADANTVTSRESMANPDALDQFTALAGRL